MKVTALCCPDIPSPRNPRTFYGNCICNLKKARRTSDEKWIHREIAYLDIVILAVSNLSVASYSVGKQSASYKYGLGTYVVPENDGGTIQNVLSCEKT